MSVFKIQMGDNSVTIEGSNAFVEHIQGIVIGALQSAPLAAGAAPIRAKRGRRAAAKPAAKAKRARAGKRRGRLPGRMVKGKYIKPGDPIPAGYREVNGKIVPVGGAKPAKRAGRKKAGRKKAAGKKRKAARAKKATAKRKTAAKKAGKKRRGPAKGSKLIDGKMYSPAQIRANPELKKKLASRAKGKK
ncbi:hypothetical protein JXA47_09835 [Candidatus Sumerlaeota bacterium]|nr:hypothetical protein [Candidatus Sumerlaeota bacterium]